MINKTKKILILSVIMLISIFIIHFTNDGNNKDIKHEANNNSNHEEPKEIPNTIDNDYIEYKYKKLEKVYPLTKIDPETVLGIIRKIDVKEDFYFYIFTKPKEFEDTNEYYAAIKIDGIFYEIGNIGYGGIELNSIKALKSSHKNTFILKGVLGANSIINYYITIEDNEPRILFIGHNVNEIDLDGDGEIEFVDSFSGRSSIYKIKNNQVYFISLNDMFDHIKSKNKRIFFDSKKHNFIVEFSSKYSTDKEPTELYYYIYTQNGFKKLEKTNLK